MEGKSPSKGLDLPFKKLSSKLSEIYKQELNKPFFQEKEFSTKFSEFTSQFVP
jgi:hypothetical protein